VTALFAIVRALHFASLMGLFGASALLAQAGGLGLPRERLRRPFATAAAVALATAVLSVGFVGGEMMGGDASGFRLDVFATVAFHTGYGHVFLARFALLAGLTWLCAAQARPRNLALTAGAALVLVSLTSHAAAAGPPMLFYARAANDAVHLLTAGFWVGGLALIAPEVAPRIADRARLVALLQLFSRWGVVSVALLLTAGTIDAVTILTMQGMRWSQTYISLLAVKIVLAVVMVAMALVNRSSILPALERGDREAAQTIPLTVLAELGAALAILTIVGFLGLTAPMQM
jgi:copper resistance protein D